MFDIGLQEMLVIGVLALLVFGPSKLPELGRMFGRAMREFRRASDEFRSTVETNLHINDFEEPSANPIPIEASSSEPPSAPAAPVETALDPEAVAAEDSGEPFCARRGSKIFHRRDCAWAKRIPELDRQYFKTLAEARDEGLQTCPVCEPWEPA